MATSIKLKTPPAADDVSCALVCVYSLLAHHGIRLNWKKFIGELSVDRFGYDTLEIAAGLLRQGVNLRAYHYDTDYIKRKRGERYIFDLAYLQRARSTFKNELSKYDLASIDSNIRFFTKHSDLVIKPVRVKLLVEAVSSGNPPIIHVDMFYLTKDQDHTCHSIILNGVRRKTFLVTDPLIGERVVSKETILKAWRAAGSYTLIIKGNGSGVVPLP